MKDLKRKGTEAILKITQSEGVEYLTFPALSNIDFITHLFSTRRGGVSEGIFSTMNLSYTRGDKQDAVDENFRRIAAAMGRSVEDFVCSDQTHTTNVRIVSGQDKGKGILREKNYTDVDGLITDEPGIVLSTFYADCVPLYFVDREHKAIGLSHSGWKGTVGRMGACTLKAMKAAYGTRPEEVIAAVGPSICQECYEVSEDVAGQFMEVFGEEGRKEHILMDKKNGKYQLDLWKANALVLREAGIKPENISVTDICTCCNSDYLFSHRASQGKRGNLGAFLCINPT